MKRLSLIVVGVLLLVITAGISTAQTRYADYAWEAGDLALSYPAGWDMPAESQTDTRATLQLAAQTAGTPNSRPPEVPFITLTLIQQVAPDTTPESLLQQTLESYGVPPGAPYDTTLLEQSAQQATGSNAQFYGMATVLPLDDGSLLLIAGRSGAAGQVAFISTFEQVSNSLVPGSTTPPLTPDYGLLWFNEQSFAAGENAFLDVAAIATAPDGTLYLADPFAGIVQIDPQSGQVIEQLTLEQELRPQDMVIAPDGTLYLADTLCNCVLQVRDGAVETLGSFDLSAPTSLALDTSQTPVTLYATDVDDSGNAIVRQVTNPQQVVPFPEALGGQPLLMTDAARQILALDENNQLYVRRATADGTRFEAANELQGAAPNLTDVVIDANGRIIVSRAEGGVDFFALDGRLLTSFSLPGALVPVDMPPITRVAAANDGTLYIAGGDGALGYAAAASVQVPTGRIGRPALQSPQPVGGLLSDTADDTPAQQTWYLSGQAGQTVTLAATASPDTPDLDLALRLLAPDGTVVAESLVDDSGLRENPLDPLLQHVALPVAGTYRVIVETLAGTGTYTLRYATPQRLDLSSGRATTSGFVGQTQPVQRYLVDASGGQTVTITVESDLNSTLDPLLTVTAPDGSLLAENNDALNPELGFDPQLEALTLPAAGTYAIDVQAFIGAGNYTLTVASP